MTITQRGRARDVGLVLILIVALLGLATYRLANAETPNSKPSEAKLDPAALSKKLDRILANQATILQKLEAMAQELQVVKVRSTH